MGFIDWHGNKQDHYQDIIEFAKMKEEMEIDNYGSMMKKKEDAKFFGVLELVSMEDSEILKLLLKEKRGLDIIYDNLLQSSLVIEILHIDVDLATQFYNDFMRYSLDILFQDSSLERDRFIKFSAVLSSKIFKVKNLISLSEHYQRLDTSDVYRKYLSQSFELKSGNRTLFWQWIRYLSDLSAKKSEETQFVNLYQRFMAHLSYYLNLLIPDADIGKRYAERKRTNFEILSKSLCSKLDISRIEDKMKNPIFQIHETEEQERREAERLAAEMAAEAVVVAAEKDAEKIAELEAIKYEELEQQKKLEREAKDRAERIRLAQFEIKDRVERLKIAELDAKERKERIKLAEAEARERAEAVRLARIEAEKIAEMEAKEREEYIRLANLEAQKRAELEEDERRKKAELEAEERRKKYISLVKYARIILGYYVLDIEDDRDMITAGRLYSAIRDKNINMERMVSLLSNELLDVIDRGILPIISKDDVKFKLNEQEILHYVEYATIYIQGSEEEKIKEMKGTLFITSQRIQLESGKSRFSIPYEYLKKAVIYDVMPEIIELASSKDNYFIRTADTEVTYCVLKLILGYWADIKEQSIVESTNMEQLKIDFLDEANMESYIFGIKTMIDSDMPEKLQKDLQDMICSLEYLDVALKKYPSYKDQSYNFFSYYIPEAVKILYSYIEYEKAGLEEQEINPVYAKVVTAVQKLSVAARQQVVYIYKNAIVDTTARAEALAEILGQDGFVDAIYKINI